MSDLRTLLEEGVGSFEPRRGGLDRTEGKRRRHHRNRRVLAGALAVAVGAFGIAIAVIGFRGTSPPPRKPTGPAVPLSSNGVIWVRAGGGDGPSFLYQVDPSTDEVTPLWHDQQGSSLPGTLNPEAIGQQYAWSPDSSELAFSDSSGYGTEIFLLSPDGMSRTQLTHDGGLDSFPSWSPDGTRIVYASDTSSPPSISAPYFEPGCEYSLTLCPSNIVVINADGTGETELTHSFPPSTMPDWSPDGSKIVFVGAVGDGTQIFVIADGSDITQLTSVDGSATEPRWSPDGSKIAFVRTQYRQPSELFVMSAGGTDIRQITHLGSDTLPDYAWSPDGAEIAFDTKSDVQSGKLFLMKPDGTDIRTLDVAPGYGLGDIAWRPVPRSASPTQNRVVPWVDRPVPASAPSPAPSVYPSGSPCSASALKLKGTGHGVGAGQAFLKVFFRNVSSGPCELLGYPKLFGVGLGDALIPIRASREGPYFANSTGAAPSGLVIAVNLTGSDLCTRRPAFNTLRLVLPSGARANVRSPSWVACGVGVSQFGVPSPGELGHVQTSPLAVSLQSPRTLVSSSTLRYAVTITNTADRSYALEPCPSYREYIYVPAGKLGSGPTVTDRSYYLNCVAVPEIPPHRSVTFAMVIDVPRGSGDAKFAWILNVTGSPAAGTATRFVPSRGRRRTESPDHVGVSSGCSVRV